MVNCVILQNVFTKKSLLITIQLIIIAALLILASPKSFAVTTNWDGGGDGTSWSDAGNWDNGVPGSGADAVFSDSLLANETLNNNLTNPLLNRITIMTDSDTFGWLLNGNALRLSNGIYDGSSGVGDNVVSIPVNATANLIYKASNDATIEFAATTDIMSHNIYLNSIGNGDILYSGNIIGTGTVIVNGTSASGATVTGIINPAVSVRSGALFMGDGRIGPLTVDSASNLRPLGGCLSTRNLKLFGDYFATLNGSTFCTSYRGIKTKGTVDVTGAKLKASIGGGYSPSKGKTFILVENDGADAIKGTFSGLPEGDIFTVGTKTFKITYKGSTGNDIVITRL